MIGTSPCARISTSVGFAQIGSALSLAEPCFAKFLDSELGAWIVCEDRFANGSIRTASDQVSDLVLVDDPRTIFEVFAPSIESFAVLVRRCSGHGS